MTSNNMFIVTGRTVNDIRAYQNRDGSHKVMFTVAVPNSYKNQDGTRGSQFINVEAFISARQTGLGVYNFIRKGDLITVGGSIRSSRYVNKEGKTIYTQALVVDNVVLQESKQVSENRARMHAQQAVAPQAQEPVPQMQPPMPAEDPSGFGGVMFSDEDEPFGAAPVDPGYEEA